MLCIRISLTVSVTMPILTSVSIGSRTQNIVCVLRCLQHGPQYINMRNKLSCRCCSVCGWWRHTRRSKESHKYSVDDNPEEVTAFDPQSSAVDGIAEKHVVWHLTLSCWNIVKTRSALAIGTQYFITRHIEFYEHNWARWRKDTLSERWNHRHRSVQCWPRTRYVLVQRNRWRPHWCRPACCHRIRIGTRYGYFTLQASSSKKRYNKWHVTFRAPWEINLIVVSLLYICFEKYFFPVYLIFL